MLWRGARARGAGGLGAADALERLAVLLEAGVGPGAAWRHLDDGGGGACARAARAAAGSLVCGEPAAPAISAAAIDESWRQAAAAWQVAEASGAPIGPALRSMSASLRAQEQTRHDIDTALAGPRMSSRVVLALPGVGVLLGLILGLDGLGQLVARPLGWALMVAAAALVAVAHLWNSRLIAAAEPPGAVAGLELELVAVAIGGGGAWDVARRRVADALQQHCPASLDEGDSAALGEVMALSRASGAPGAELLRSVAATRRREARARSAEAVERLGVLSMLPLGVCILPAFVLVGVVPLALSLLSSPGGA
ncbi:type II secretion system F family protein [Frondihabitans australicus]|uniref:type II secretion system F family protein n=1 Tax=Frondihabitans australicus TaxID=386892 RepID=UPI001475441E|nr:type II secretion system F family protein [Frondihabitans australicus]